MQGCSEEMKEKISAYLDKECTAEEAALVESHLAQCKDCAAFYRQISELSLLTGELPVPIPKSLHRNIMSSVKRQNTKRESFKKYVAVFAASVLFCVMLGSFFYTDFWKAKIPNTLRSADAASSESANTLQAFVLYAVADGKFEMGPSVPTADVSQTEEAVLTLDGEAAVYRFQGTEQNGTALYDQSGELWRLEFPSVHFNVAYGTDGKRYLEAE